MKYQRGIADMLLIAIVAIALIVACTIAFKAWTSYIASVDQKGYDRGRSTALKEVGDRDNVALQNAIKERNAAQQKLDDALKVNEGNQKVSDEAYRKGKRDAKTQYDNDLAAIKSGNLILHSHQAAPAVGTGLKAPGDKNKVADSGPGSVGSGDDRLSQDDSGFLLWLSGEADRLRQKVNSLIDVVKGDRVQINGAWNEQDQPVSQMSASIN